MAGDIEYSIKEIADRIKKANIICFPASAYPAGAVINTLFRKPRIIEAVEEHLRTGGLILGISGGFYALIKLGLLPFGEIRDAASDSPVLYYNSTISSGVACIKIISDNSPFLRLCELGALYYEPVSHGEGGLLLAEETDLLKNGQIASVYVNENGTAYKTECGDGRSLYAVEGVLSPDGRVFGKMGHSERTGIINVPNYDYKIFESAAGYFR
jgi:phosphoribosylformylglycinamidine synthase